MTYSNFIQGLLHLVITTGIITAVCLAPIELIVSVPVAFCLAVILNLSLWNWYAGDKEENGNVNEPRGW